MKTSIIFSLVCYFYFPPVKNWMFQMIHLDASKEKSGRPNPESYSCNDLAYRYKYNGETVYLFTDDGNCNDAFSIVYNENCDVCTMGGITGHGDGRCPDFYQLASNEELVWRK